jgi:hypothetical protein
MGSLDSELMLDMEWNRRWAMVLGSVASCKELLEEEDLNRSASNRSARL